MKKTSKATKRLALAAAGILAVAGFLVMILRSYDRMLSWLFSQEDDEDDEALFSDWED